jgi:hypothetical protein
VPDSNWLFRITGPAHRRLCLQGPQILEPMERIERSSVAYHATALPLSYIAWSQRGGIRNPDLRATSAALFHLSYSGVERVRRIELRFSDRRSDAQPICHTRRNLGADGDNRNLFSGLEAQGTPYIPRPLIKDFRDAIQLSKTCIETHFYCVASKRKRVRQNLKLPIKQKKRAALFGWPPAS